MSLFFENNTRSNSCSLWNGSTVDYDVMLFLILHNKTKEHTAIKELILPNSDQFTSLV